MATPWGAFCGTRILEIVKKNNNSGLLWKRIKLTPTRKANAKNRLRRVWQNEAVLKVISAPKKAISAPTPSKTSGAVGGQNLAEKKR